LNGYLKTRLEQAFDQTHPGYALRIRKLDYSLRTGRLIATSVTIIGRKSRLSVAQVEVAGIPWLRLLWKRPALLETTAHAKLIAADCQAQFAESPYRLRCARLAASVPDSNLVAEGLDLAPAVADEAFFARHDFRTTRFHATVPQCRVLGLGY